ncbi:MAG TPA: M23 family metallopeptidase [Flavobacteriaceae bacterium]|nr:M23 family metallopeptidase [Flavobacteriaceae bacterium]
MSEKEKKTRRFGAKKLFHKYRLVILNEDTFEERVSFKLTRLNVFVAVSLSIIILIIGTTILIAFTPLREYIPGYSSPDMRRRAVELTYRADSLENEIRQNRQYFQSIRKMLTGHVMPDNEEDSVVAVSPFDPGDVDFSPSKTDSLLREKVAEEDRYNLLDIAVSKTDFSLFPPVKGYVSQEFNTEEKHYGVDIVTEKNMPVKAVADGTVILSEWTAETGYVMILEHSYGLISVYKHNASLSKKQGEMVKAGEVIAIVGNTGEFTTGPHLHFELWSDGYPMNPTDFISFEQ